MKIFIGEYICGGGLRTLSPSEIQPSLLREGRAMLSALIEDVSQFAEVTTVVDSAAFDETSSPLHGHLSALHPHRINQYPCVSIDSEAELIRQWGRVARSCDFSLVIAPETDATLLRIVSSFRDNDIEVVAPSNQFIKAASDKRQTAKHFHESSVPHPFTTWLRDTPNDTVKHLATEREPEPNHQSRSYLIKPYDGCGSQGIQCFDAYPDALNDLDRDQVLQEKVVGQNVSVAVISNDRQTHVLPAVSQRLKTGTFEYLGGEGPLGKVLQVRARDLALQALDAMPKGRRGFVGLDLILGDAQEDDYVIEINPRVTTSYVGLRKIIKGNLAASLFDLEFGSTICREQEPLVCWNADGSLALPSNADRTS